MRRSHGVSVSRRRSRPGLFAPWLLLAASGCGPATTPIAPPQPTPAEPPPEPTAIVPAADDAGDSIAADEALLTITLPADAPCPGGVFTIDGVRYGDYPANRAVVPTGRHVVGIRSDGDCAGYGDVEADFVPGEERVLDATEFH